MRKVATRKIPKRIRPLLVVGLLAAALWLPGSVLASGNLAAHWAFDETSGTTAADSSGNGKDGLNTDATISTDVPPTAFANPRSLSFNGTSSVVDAPPQDALTGNHSRTISLWFKTADASENQGIFDSGDTVTNTAMEIYTVAAGGAKYSPPTNPGGISIVMWDNDIYVPVGITNVADNQWHFLTFTYDETSQHATLYFDGVAEQAYLWDNPNWSPALVSQPFTTVHPLNTTANDVLIGQTRTGYFALGNTFFTGNIDDVRIYDVALQPEQVNNLAGGSNDPGAPVSDSPPALSNGSSSSSSDSNAPDTGYGKPSQASLLVTILATGAIVFTGVGLRYFIVKGTAKGKTSL